MEPQLFSMKVIFLKEETLKRLSAKKLQPVKLLALFTPWSAQRSWVWSEVGAAWGQNKPILGVLYGLTPKKFDTVSGGKAMFEDINVLDLNEMEKYFSELQYRVEGRKND